MPVLPAKLKTVSKTSAVKKGLPVLKPGPITPGVPPAIFNLMKLKSIMKELNINPAQAAPQMAMRSKTIGNIRGGIKQAHIHIDGQVQMLNDKQWKAISAKALEEFQAKLSKTKSISFEKAMAMSQAMGMK